MESRKQTNKQTTVMILITLANEDDGRWRLGWEISLGARINIHWKQKIVAEKNISTSEKFNKKIVIRSFKSEDLFKCTA